MMKVFCAILLGLSFMACQPSPTPIPPTLMPSPTATASPTATPTATPTAVVIPPVVGRNHIAFTRRIQFANTGWPQDSGCHIFVMNGDGSNPIDLTSASRGCEHAPAYSPDGKMIGYLSGGRLQSTLAVMNQDGSNPHAVSPRAYWTYDLVLWSKDGQHLALYDASDHAWHSYKLGESKYDRIETLSSSSWYFHDYSPDGKQRVALCSPVSRKQPVPKLCLHPALETEMGNPPPKIFGASWSPDGKRVVFAAGRYIYLADADGTGLFNLGDGDFPSWQP